MRIPSWWAAASILAATASAVATRTAPASLGPHAMTAALFLAAASAACAAAASRRRDLLASAVPFAAASAVACGISAGALQWPHSEGSWLFAAASAWLAAQLAHLSSAARLGEGAITGAQSLPLGVIVFARHATSCAWQDPSGTVRTWTGPPGLRGAFAALSVLLRETLLSRRAPKLCNVRRLHAAEHIAVLAATSRTHRLPVSPVTPFCGGTVAALAIPAYLLATMASPPEAHTMAMLWAMCGAYAVRTAALASPGMRWLLTPGLWLQRLTTAPPHEQEIRIANAAVEAVFAEMPSHPDLTNTRSLP